MTLFFRKANRISNQFALGKVKIPRNNSKRKLQNMVRRKMTRTKFEIFC
jgi:hypothetical protein